MTDSATMKIEIQRTSRRWICISYVKYPEWPNEAVTVSGYDTLKSTLWHKVLHCMDLNAELTSVTVKDKSMPLGAVWDMVNKALVNGPLAYNLPAIKNLLGT